MSGRKIYITEEEYELYQEYIRNFEAATTQEKVIHWHEKAMEIVKHAKARQVTKMDEILESIHQLNDEERNELIRRLLSSEEDRDYYALLDQMLNDDWDNGNDDFPCVFA